MSHCWTDFKAGIKKPPCLQGFCCLASLPGQFPTCHSWLFEGAPWAAATVWRALPGVLFPCTGAVLQTKGIILASAAQKNSSVRKDSSFWSPWSCNALKPARVRGFDLAFGWRFLEGVGFGGGVCVCDFLGLFFSYQESVLFSRTTKVLGSVIWHGCPVGICWFVPQS